MSALSKPNVRKPALWRCPNCGEGYTTKNQWHACGSFDIEALFARSEPVVRRLYDRFLKAVRKSGPVKVLRQKTRIALQVRMRFAALMPQKTVLKGHLVLARPHPSARFEEIETYSPRNHVHIFRLRSQEAFDAGFCRLTSYLLLPIHLSLSAVGMLFGADPAPALIALGWEAGIVPYPVADRLLFRYAKTRAGKRDSTDNLIKRTE